MHLSKLLFSFVFTQLKIAIDSLSYIQTAISVPVLFGLLFSSLGRSALIVTSAFLPLFIASFLNPVPQSLRKDYLQTRERLIHELPTLRSKICEQTQPLIIAQHGDQFLVTALLSTPAQQKMPIEPRQGVYWLIHPPLTFNSSIFDNNSIDNKFLLIEGEKLKQDHLNLTRQERRQLIALNPHLQQLFRTK